MGRTAARSAYSLVIIALLSGCSRESLLLNSERIEQRFGSYGIEIVATNADVRRSNLYSTEGGIKTGRTYALVRFTESIYPAFAGEHDAVANGASLGAVFKASGWNIDKQTVHIGSLDIDADRSPILRQMRIDAPATLALHIYRLEIEKDGATFHYASIAEAHHPDYQTIDDIRRIYPPHPTSAIDDGDIESLISLMNKQ